MIRVVPDGPDASSAPRWSHDHHTSRLPGRVTDRRGHTTRPDHGPRVTRDEVRDLGRLRRTTADRKVAGVAGGLARHLDIDPLILRVGFVVLAFFGGAGLILYAAGWALVPEDGPRPRRRSTSTSAAAPSRWSRSA